MAFWLFRLCIISLVHSSIAASQPQRSTGSLLLFSDSETNLTKFAYAPLDPEVQSIRVVRVQSGPHGSPLQLQHRSQPLTSHGHNCLSYTWGSPGPATMISIDRRGFMVGWNLYQLLLRARQMGIEDWLWIDAISIDQTNVTERSEQVQVMHQIYRDAREVIIYPEDIPNYSYPVDRDLCGSDLSSLDHYFQRTADLETNTRSCLADIESSRYWRRLWIVQEILLARQSYLVIGQHLVSWEQFQCARMEMDRRSPRPDVTLLDGLYTSWSADPSSILGS